ncbi:hypothetical protein [Mycobacterium tilburgii]|uniref:hypothetical protein n=1 Tax=Mycobacterium tilburgii TaxID=44467 RepID=UPI0021B29772|nr:hypothetical protein [Mycobacterium tilburgii]
MPYPPGFPVLAPGHVVSKEILYFLAQLDVKEIHRYNPEFDLSVFTQEALARLEAQRGGRRRGHRVPVVRVTRGHLGAQRGVQRGPGPAVGRRRRLRRSVARQATVGAHGRRCPGKRRNTCRSSRFDLGDTHARHRRLHPLRRAMGSASWPLRTPPPAR